MKKAILGGIGILALLGAMEMCGCSASEPSCSSPETISTLQKIIDEKAVEPLNEALRNPFTLLMMLGVDPTNAAVPVLEDLTKNNQTLAIKIKENTIITVRREGNKSTCKVMLQWIAVPSNKDITPPDNTMDTYTVETTDKGDQILVTLLK